MSSCSPGAQMLSPTGSKRFKVATIRLVCIVYLSPFLFIFFLSWSETIPWGKVKHQKTCTEGPFKCNVMFLLLQMWISFFPYVHTFDILHLVSVMRKDILLISFCTTKFCSSLLKFCRWQHDTHQHSFCLMWAVSFQKTRFISRVWVGFSSAQQLLDKSYPYSLTSTGKLFYQCIVLMYTVLFNIIISHVLAFVRNISMVSYPDTF